MKCDRCNRQATVTCQYSVNGVGETLHLCPICYEKWKQEQGEGFMESLFSQNPSFAAFPSALQLFPRAGGRCKHCGQTYEAYLSSGLLGCAHCYEAFRKELRSEVLPRMQQGLSYRGRLYAKPSRLVGSTDSKGQAEGFSNPGFETACALPTEEKIREWKQALQLAVQEERYEDAARLRDQIQHAQNQGEIQADSQTDTKVESQAGGESGNDRKEGEEV